MHKSRLSNLLMMSTSKSRRLDMASPTGNTLPCPSLTSGCANRCDVDILELPMLLFEDHLSIPRPWIYE